jgi:hypothetical protein
VSTKVHCLQPTSGDHVAVGIEAEHGVEVFGRGNDSGVSVRRRIRAERCDQYPAASLRSNLQSRQLPGPHIEIIAGPPFAVHGRGGVALPRRTMKLDGSIHVRKFKGSTRDHRHDLPHRM